MATHTAPPGLGINVAHDSSVSDSTPAATKLEMIRQQCSLLKSLGITKVRINLPIYTTQSLNHPFRDSLFSYGNIAHNEFGMYVIMGYNAAPLTTANYENFKTQQRAGAIMAASYGIDEWQVGNEEDLYVGFGTAALEALRPRLQETCNLVKVTDSFPGVVSTAITTNVYDPNPSGDRTGWKAELATWSPYMKLNLHIYFSVAQSSFFNGYADRVVGELGADNVYCGEFGVNGAQGDGRLSSAFANDKEWVTEIKRRMKRLQDGGWQSYYYFCLTAFDNDEWSAVRRQGPFYTDLLWALSDSRRNQIDLV